MGTQFAIPDLGEIKLAVVIKLGNPLAADVLNLVIFFTQSPEINWVAVNNLADPKKQGKAFLSVNISSSPWSYRCCDYTVGLLLGLIEVATGKRFQSLPIPNFNFPIPEERRVAVRCYKLV